MPDKYIIIVAGGKGERMASETPKQFLLLAGEPVLMHTLRLFYEYDSQLSILLVLPESHKATWAPLCQQYDFGIPHQVVAGGNTRFHSVQNALRFVPSGCIVGVHDGVRPLVSKTVVKNCFDKALSHPAVIPVLPVVESIREVEGERSKPVDRQRFRIVQTPQVFQSDVLLKAYSAPFQPSFTDDASVVEPWAPVTLLEGNKENIKLTTPEDFVVAEAFLSLSSSQALC